MVRKKVMIRNKQGLHARPANLFVKACMQYPCDIFVRKGEKEINAKSILHIMTAGISHGTEIELLCNGPNENEALDALLSLIEFGLE
ncbi:MAG: HPr family phosphocarrier protein [Oscillospiraceae bacterium]|jgi:phosphocarrier protein|nr:HPr family phosphocarrier protein [Oscillospiraceae bacterium]